MPRDSQGFEWPTVFVLLATYVVWLAGITVLAQLWLPLGIVAVALASAQHASISHEVLHGHPFRNRHLNAALVFPAVSLVVPYMRFRDTHLAHHRDSRLTDPYDDPESNFLDPDRWAGLSAPHRAMLRVNNTLAGRMVIGPLLGQIQFMAGDMRAIWAGDRRVALGWLWHIPAVAIVVWVFAHVALMPLWAFVVASYVGVSLLKIRTFLEHRAHVDARARTVVIEDRGFLAFLFLNNNFHSVHHMYPCVPWYRLPGLYAGRRTEFLTRNEGYRYGSYRQIFGRYLWTAKDPVPHPLWSRKR